MKDVIGFMLKKVCSQNISLLKASPGCGLRYNLLVIDNGGFLCLDMS